VYSIGSTQLLALGVYPDISLAEARSRRDDARKLLSNDIDPSEHRKIIKAAKIEAAANSFRSVGQEWFAKQKLKWSEVHATKTLWMLERNLFPWLGDRPIAEIKGAGGGSLFQDEKVILSKLRCHSSSEQSTNSARPITPKPLECSPQ
jgi:hypothetical protein